LNFLLLHWFGDLQAGDFVQALWQKKSQHPLKCYDYELLDKLEVVYFFTIFHSSPSIMYWNSDRFSSSITLSKS